MAQVDAVARALRSGISAGAAIASFLHTRIARDSGRLLFIIGDPRVRTLQLGFSDRQALDGGGARRSEEHEVPGWTDATAQTSVDDQDFQNDVAEKDDFIIRGMRMAFLKGCVEEAVSGGNGPSEILLDLKKSLSQVSNKLRKRPAAMIRDTEYLNFLPKIQKFIREANFTDLWIRRYGVKLSGGCICPSCGTAQSEFRSNLNVKALVRVMIVCQYCGVSQDAYPNNRVGIRLSSSGDVQLLGNVKDSGWAGELSVWVGGDLLARWDWPNPGGYLERQFHVTGGLPNGLLRVHLWLYRGFEIVGASVRCRL